MGNPLRRARVHDLGVTGLGLGILAARAAGRAARAIGGTARVAAEDPLIRRRVLVIGGNAGLLLLPRLLPGGFFVTPVGKVVLLAAGGVTARAARRAGLAPMRSVEDLGGVTLGWIARTSEARVPQRREDQGR